MLRMFKRQGDLHQTENLYDTYDWNKPTVLSRSMEASIKSQVLREHGVVPSDRNLDLYNNQILNGVYVEDDEVSQLWYIS